METVTTETPIRLTKRMARKLLSKISRQCKERPIKGKVTFRFEYERVLNVLTYTEINDGRDAGRVLVGLDTHGIPKIIDSWAYPVDGRSQLKNQAGVKRSHQLKGVYH